MPPIERAGGPPGLARPLAHSAARQSPAPAVNPERIEGWLRAFARIGYDAGGGMRRLAFSRSELRARQLLLHLMERGGLTTRLDGIGNCFGHLAGAAEPDAPPVLIGSHLDTVPDGGRFDGVLGVVAGLEIAAAVRERGMVTRRPIEIVSFAGEESSRFGRGTLGSGVLAGVWDPDEVLTLRDASGQSLGQVLARFGIDREGVASARREPGSFAAYLELHIEQGRVLESAGARLGVVEAIAAPARFRLRLTGRADHSGATPMGLRRDALAGAAEVVLAVERRATAAGNVVGTVGVLGVQPGAMNVVPGQTDLAIDVRAIDRAARDPVVAAIRADIEEIATRRQLTARLETLSDEAPVPLDPTVVATLERAARAYGHQPQRLPSGAGHDAMHLARLCPTGMLMVPSRAGVSHNRDEWTDLGDIVAGVQVLLAAALELTNAD